MGLSISTIGLAVLGMSLMAATGSQHVPKPKAAPKPTAEENYAKTCQVCHGVAGKSPLPMMNLADGEWKHGASLQAIVKVITEGVPGTQMMPNKDKFSKAEIEALARLVRTFDPKLKAKK